MFFDKAKDVKGKAEWIEGDIKTLAEKFNSLGSLDKRWLKKNLGNKKYKLLEVLVAVGESISVNEEFIIYEEPAQLHTKTFTGKTKVKPVTCSHFRLPCRH